MKAEYEEDEVDRSAVAAAAKLHQNHVENIVDLYERVESLRRAVDALINTHVKVVEEPPHPCASLKPGDPVMAYETAKHNAHRREFIRVVEGGGVVVKGIYLDETRYRHGLPTEQWDREVLGNG